MCWKTFPYRWDIANNRVRTLRSNDEPQSEWPVKDSTATFDAAIQPTIRCDSRSRCDQPILRTVSLFACSDGIWGIGEYGRTGSADDAAGGSGAGLARVF